MKLVDRITRYLFLNDPLEKADVIFVPGSPFNEPVLRAAELYGAGYAPLLLPSGNRWLFQSLASAGGMTEWERMRAVAEATGVPQEAILREDRARHTVDNARLSREVLEQAGVPVKTAILCCQSFHGRRCLKAYAKAFPGVRILVCGCATRGFDAASWHQSPLGMFKVCTELMKCTGLFFALISLARSERWR